jgi:hypothetical protein
MDPTKHYKDGRFVKTVDDYPDGPWRGGVTTHTFEKDGVRTTM